MTTCLPLTLSVQKPIVIFGINDINEKMLFQNGLTQNVIMLYDLFEYSKEKFVIFLLDAPLNKAPNRQENLYVFLKLRHKTFSVPHLLFLHRSYYHNQF